MPSWSSMIRNPIATVKKRASWIAIGAKDSITRSCRVPTPTRPRLHLMASSCTLIAPYINTRTLTIAYTVVIMDW